MSANALEVMIMIAIGTGLTLYVVLAGADFGGGFWDLVARGPLHERERALISEAIGPVWEANHVWLIFVVTGLFAAFPSAFADLSVGLYLPFSIAIVGIVFRGAAFAFRAHGGSGSAWQRRWTRVFGIASLITPVVLGMSGAAIASERIRVVNGQVRAGILAAWTGPLSLAAGPLVLSMCAFLAATFLTVEAVARGRDQLEEVFRRRAIVSGVVAGALAVVGLVAVRAEAPIVWAGMTEDGWPLAVLSAAGGVASLVAVVRRHYRFARVAVAVAVASVVAGWGVAQWPYLIPPDVAVHDAAAPVHSLRPLAYGFVAGGIVLVPSLVILFRVFKASRNMPNPSG